MIFVPGDFLYLDNTPHELVNLKSLKQGRFAEMFIMNWISSFSTSVNLLAYWAFPQALFTVELEIGLQIEALHEKY